MYPPCMLRAFAALEQGRHLVGIVRRQDHIAIISLTRLKLTAIERNGYYNTDDKVRVRFTVGQLLQADRLTRYR